MKLSMVGLALALAMVGSAGCHSSKATTAKAPEPPPPPPPPPLVAEPAGPTCDAVADHMRDEMVKAAANSPMDISRLVPVFRRVVAERCIADAWSADAIACLATAVGDGLNACEGKITIEQSTTLSKAINAAFNLELMQPEATKSKSLAAPPKPDDPCGGDE